MELISYAMDFVSFLIQNIRDKSKIKSIILFGSVARDEATKDSDLDIFIDIAGYEKPIEREIETVKEKFFDSIKFTKYWKLLGIENEINVVVGELDKWKLRDTMLGNAIILYQYYAPKLEGGRSKVIFFWGNIKPDSRRVMLNKKLFGYKHYEHYYKGILEKYEGKKLGSNVIILNVEGLNELLKAFKHFKAPVKILRVFEYQE